MVRKIFVVFMICLFSLGVLCEEGYDPMIQITHQFAKPNLVIILDVTGSMAWDMSGVSVGVDSTGYPGWLYDGAYTKNGWPGKFTVGYPGGASKYVHVYFFVANKPSRMSIVKNALGNSVALFDWTPPASGLPATIGSWTKGTSTVDGLEWYWMASQSSTKPATPCNLTVPTCPVSNNNVPLPIGGTISNIRCPKDLIGQTANQVNWGLVIYSAINDTCTGTCIKGNCSLEYGGTVIQTFDLTESGNVTNIQNALKLNSNGGLNAGGSTNTRGAMNYARNYLSKSVTGGDLTYYPNNKINNLQRDWKFFDCGRPVGAILVTDGQSNACNQVDSPNSYYAWIKPCGSAPYSCDGNQGTYDCDRRNGINRQFSLYPPGPINELWNATVSDGGKDFRLNARTWVIGVSPSVSPCELNFNAYIGRTDASAPKGDTGFDISSDLDRLPNMNYVPDPTSGKWIYTTLKDNEETVSHYNNNDPRNTGKNYAFFAQNADDISNAFGAIAASVAAGDYTTSSPVASPTSTVTSSIAFLASADFPEWKGHLYCYDATGDISVLLYDAGENLTAQPDNSRRIYTWDNGSPPNLVPVDSAHLNQLQTIAAAFTPGFVSTDLTSQVVDFIRGNNGSGVARAWKLGPIINSTPTVVISPSSYKQNILDPSLDDSHDNFDVAYSSRKPLLYVGSDDGLLHCFMITDESESGAKPYLKPGYELFAIVPPNLLPKQVTLYNNYINLGMPTGQARQPKDHIYGVANSPRYGDVYFGSDVWKTVMFLTEGPGGEMVSALDITDPFGRIFADPPEPPVSVLWYKDALAISELKKTWSMPAFGAVTPTEIRGAIGSGYDTTIGTTSPNLIIFDPKDGTIIKKNPISEQANPTPWVKNQAFADAVMFQTQTHGYENDNIADLGLQADLHGKLWFYDFASQTFLGAINASGIAGNSQPIYYSPAVTGYNLGEGNTYDIYAFASGTPYEKDPDVTGPNVGSGGSYFIPSIYIAMKKPWGKNLPSATEDVTQIPIQSLQWTDSESGDSFNFGRRTQVTTSPMMIVPDKPSDADKLTLLFAFYDPDTTDCAGTSYIETIALGVEDGNITMAKKGYSAGSGAISGFAVVGKNVVVAKSGRGEQKATISKVPGVKPPWSSGAPTPIGWRELQ